MSDTCKECGMLVDSNEYHPYAACLMFRGSHSQESVRSNLADVMAYARSCQRSDDADRLAVIESQVLWRTEDMPRNAVGWFKNTSGKSRWCKMWVETASTVLHQAPDYRPDEPGPCFLPILDPPT